MYELVEKDTFQNVVKYCKPTSIVEIDIITGDGNCISVLEVCQMAERSSKIYCHADDLFLIYDVYYQRNSKEKMAKVLL